MSTLARSHAPDPLASLDKARHVIDAKSDPSGRSAILYRQGDLLVLGLSTADWLAGDGRRLADSDMETYVFPHDPQLPGLATAFDADAMKELLSDPDSSAAIGRVVRYRAELVRYRPLRRCTLRLDLVVRDERTGAYSSRTLYAKIYHDPEKAAAVHHETALLSDAAALRGAGVVVPRPVAHVRALAMVVHEPVNGTPLGLLIEGAAANGHAIGSRAVEPTERVAAALSALHASGVVSQRRRPIEPRVERMLRRAGEVARVQPAVGSRMLEVAAALAGTLGLLDDRAGDSLVHGDCKPSQFTITPSGIGILDFDHCGMADPASDVGDFVATLRQLEILDRRTTAIRTRASTSVGPSLAPLSEAFLRSYRESRGTDDAFARRVAWYETWSLLRKAYRAFLRSHRSPVAGALVDESRRRLNALMAGDAR